VPSARGRALAVVAIVAISTPLAVAFETVLRRWMFPPEFDEVRAWLEPIVTPWMWLTPVLAALGIPLGLRLQRWLIDRNLARLPAHRRSAATEATAVTDAMLLSTSVPQVPAVIATLGLLIGSAALPVLVATAVATAGVLVIGGVATRRLPKSAVEK
jgi:hypothetical protein